MAETPTRLQLGTDFNDAIPLINDDFDKVIQSIRDLGANTTAPTLITVTVPASGLTSFAVTLTSQGTSSSSVHQVTTLQPVAAVSGIAPQVDIFVDTNDAVHQFPIGGGLTAGQQQLYLLVSILNTGFTNSVGAYMIQINNRDTSSHTYYISTACGYFPTGATGYFQ